MDRISKNCCDNRLNGITVALQDDPFQTTDFDRASIFGKLMDANFRERVEIIPKIPKSGRYLKIWLPGSDQLALCEVQVFQEKG